MIIEDLFLFPHGSSTPPHTPRHTSQAPLHQSLTARSSASGQIRQTFMRYDDTRFHRMKRRTRHLRYALPFALLVLWIWSYVLSLTARVDLPGGCLSIKSREAHLDFTWQFGQVHQQWLDVQIKPIQVQGFDQRTTRGWIRHHFAGFRVGPKPRIFCLPGARLPPWPHPPPPQRMTYEAVIPHWLFLFVSLTPFMVTTLRQRSRTARHGRGLCANCGYDLRATPTQCPECGTPIPSPA